MRWMKNIMKTRSGGELVLYLNKFNPSIEENHKEKELPFFYANSLLNRKNYVLAAFQFESFVKSYPISQKVEEAAFLGAYCYYKQSPRHSLDQDETRTAIEKLQNFINFYPFSEKLAEANDLIQELNTKLEYKAFEIAKQYNTIRDYTSAIKVLNSFISDYPGTSYREDALYYLFDSSYQLAINSIPTKRLERLNNAVKVYDELINDYPETKFFDESKKKMTDIEKEIAIFAADKS